MLRLEDEWIWDSWVADDGDLYHLYFLKAPRSLGDPGLRHRAASVGHATSPDLENWTYLGNTLGPHPSGWDDLAVWTGSVVRSEEGPWLMFYTAVSSGPHGIKDQRIGVVESDDLHTWRRTTDKPVVEPDSRWYQTLAEDSSASETWRDPFVYRDPDGDGWHMLFAARVDGFADQDNGVIGHARSRDLREWEVLPPLSEGGAGFGEIEVAQVRIVDGTPVLVFTCHPYQQSADRKAAYPRACTWSITGQPHNGPWDITKAQPFLADPVLFAAPLVQQRDATWALVGFQNKEQEGIFDFEIVDPIPVEVRDGALVART